MNTTKRPSWVEAIRALGRARFATPDLRRYPHLSSGQTPDGLPCLTLAFQESQESAIEQIFREFPPDGWLRGTFGPANKPIIWYPIGDQGEGPDAAVAVAFMNKTSGSKRVQRVPAWAPAEGF